MQLIHDNFTLIENPNIKHYLKDKEFCIKNISESDETLYGRTYHYKGMGVVEIEDRILPIKLKTELIGKKKKLTYYEI